VRILFAVHYWLPHLGGVELEARTQARLLVERGHEVGVITSRLAGDPDTADDDGVTIHRVPANNFLERRFGLPYPVFSPQLLARTERLVDEADVVVGHTHTFLSTVAAARSARRTRTPFVLIQNNPYIEYPFPLDLVQRAADATLGRFTLRRADRLVAISEFTADYVRRLAPGRPVEVMYLGVDADRFSPVGLDERSATRDRLGLPVNSFIALTVRRLFYRNGVDSLLDAAGLLKDLEDLHIVIGGSGPDRTDMERRLREERLDRVRLLGFVPDDDLADLYRAADVFVLPSRTAEGFGLVLLEAAACAVPSIATRSGAPPELIENGVTGRLVDPSEPTQLAAALRDLVNDPESTRRLGRAAYERHHQHTWEHSVDQLEATLLSVVAGRAT